MQGENESGLAAEHVAYEKLRSAEKALSRAVETALQSVDGGKAGVSLAKKGRGSKQDDVQESDELEIRSAAEFGAWLDSQ